MFTITALTKRIRRSRSQYEHFADEPATSILEGKLERSKSLPSHSTKKLAAQVDLPNCTPIRPVRKANSKATHPLFSLFHARPKKKTTSRPEFARYLEYVKEGGVWDITTDKPVIHYK